MYTRYLIQVFFILHIITPYNYSISSPNIKPTSITAGFHKVSNIAQEPSTVFTVSLKSDRSGCIQTSSANISPQESLKQAIAYVLYDTYCKQHFRMSAQQKYDLMSCCRYKTFTTRLLACQNLDDEIIWELWHEFVKSKKLHGNDQQKCKHDIQDELEKRNALKAHKQNQKLEQQAQAIKLQKEEELQQKLRHEQEKKREAETLRFISQYDIARERMQRLGIDPDQCIFLPSDMQMIEQEYTYCNNLCDQMMAIDDSHTWHARKEALQKSYDQKFKQSWQEIPLSDQTQGYLKFCGIEPELFSNCYGTALQHEINRQNCTTIEWIAQQKRTFPTRTIFLDHATECVNASCWANEFEAMILSINLQDLAAQCCKVAYWVIENAPLYCKAIFDGVVESAADFVHMVSHPYETISGFAHAAYFAIETVALYNPELMRDYPDVMGPLRQQRQELIGSAISSSIDHLTNSTGPHIVKAATKFTSDCIFQHKAMQAVGAIAGLLRTQSGTMKTMEFVNDVMGHEPEFAGIAQHIKQATEELESIIQKNIAEKIVTQKPKTPLPKRSQIFTISDSTGKVKNYGGKIPVRNIELLHNTEYWIKQTMKKVNTQIESSLLNQYSKTTQLIGNAEMSICMDLEHIVNIEYKLLKDSSGAFYTINIKGGHLAGTMRKLEQEGLVIIKSFEEFGGGCIEYRVEDLFSGKTFTHTEYPPHWSVEKIAQETQNKCMQEINHGHSLKKPIHIMSSDEKFKLRIIIDTNPTNHQCIVVNESSNVHVVTSHPIYER